MTRLKHYRTIEEALKQPGVFIDLRSESEYQEDHVPGAVNIPLLTDEDRKTIGIIYHQQGNEIAKMEGFKLFARRHDVFMSAIREARKEGLPLYVYCWRGGSRSEYVLEMLTEMGFEDVYKITGGYKKFRGHVMKRIPELAQELQPMVVHGYTGAGKTDLLKMLQDAGKPVLCLETLAQNSGSVFGTVFFRQPPPTQKHFESLIYTHLSAMKTGTFFVESESRRVGTVFVPEVLMESMRTGYHILMETSLANRTENLYRNYVQCGSGDDEIAGSLEKLRKRLGHEKIDQWLTELQKGNYREVIGPLLTDYYDPLYQYSIDQYHYDAVVEYDTYDDAFERLMAICEERERKNP